MKAALEGGEWDIILCDYSMPHFDALKALNVLRQSELDIPFIIISGTVGEEVAVKAMLTGANDYLPKDNLTRLVPAIERELQEAENRRQQCRTEEERRLIQERYQALFEYAPDGIIIANPESYYLDANAGMCRMLGYTHEELIGMHASDIVAETEVEQITGALNEIKAERGYHREWVFRRKDGSAFTGDMMVTMLPDGNLMAIIRDITESRRAETEHRIISEIIQGVATTPNVEEFLKLVHGSIRQVVYAENCYVMLHEQESDMMHYEFWVDKYDPAPPAMPVGRGFSSYVLHTGRPLLLTDEARKTLIEQHEVEQIGSPSASWLGVPLRTPSKTIGILAICHYEKVNAYSRHDIEFMSSVSDQIALAIERKRTEEELRESESLLAASQRITHQGSWVIDLSGSADTQKNKERWSDEHYRIFGFEPGQIEITDEKFYNSVHPDDRELLSRVLREAIEQHRPFDIEHRIILPDGAERIVQARAELVLDVKNGQALKLLGSIQDITNRKLAENALREGDEKFHQLADNIDDVSGSVRSI